MKKTELEKSKGLKIRGQMQHAGIPSRFAAGSAALPDRREQRKLDQAAGLVPFAVKLPEALTGQLRERAAQEGLGLNELTARLLQAALAAAGPSVAPAEAPKAAETAPAKKAGAKKTATKKAPVKEAGTKEAAAPSAPAKKAAAEPAAPAKKAAVKKAAAKKAPSQAVKATR